MAVIKKQPPKKNRSKIIELDSNNQIAQAKWYPIDWDKVTTIKDLKVIMANMGLGCSEDAPAYVQLEKYLRKND